MNSHMVILKQMNMLCNKCVLHVLKALTKLEEIHELEVDLDKKLIKVVHNDKNVTNDMITKIVNDAIEVRIPKILSKVN